MTLAPSQAADRSDAADGFRRLRRHLLGWNAAWLCAVVAAVVVLGLGWPELTPKMAAAMLAMVVPAVLSFLPLPERLIQAGGLLFVWAGAGALASSLTGGVTSPMAAWCLAPVAAAAVMGRRRLLVLAVLLSFLAAAVAALVQLAGVTSPPAIEGLQIWFALIALFTTAAGVGGGAVLALLRRRHAAPEAAVQVEAPAEVPPTPVAEPLLDAQPYLLLRLSADGVVKAVFGETPDALPRPEPGLSLFDSASLASRQVLISAVRSAVQDGRAACDFAPLGDPDRTCAASFKAIEGDLAAVIHDVSQERWREAAAEAGRAEAEALNAGKSRFLANMSHELRTPLNAVMGFSDVMRSRLFGELSPRYGEYVDMIHESGRHLLDLINDVLDMSKIEAERYPLQLEPFDAREAVSAALRLVRVQADSSGISLRGVLPPTPLEVDADRRALKQIVLNLASNALKFTPRSGTVTVSAQAQENQLEIVVADTGVGIAPEDLERLGRPYEQAGDANLRAQGTGLGLSLVRAFAELHGGTMQIESALGEGTRVTVRLPVMQAAANEDPPQPQGAQIIPFAR